MELGYIPSVYHRQPGLWAVMDLGLGHKFHLGTAAGRYEAEIAGRSIPLRFHEFALTASNFKVSRKL